MTVPFDTSPAFAPLRRIRHGFFGRRGGVSTGAFAHLNASEAGGDQPDDVGRNRRIAVAALGFEVDQPVLLRQVHSATVVDVASPFPADSRPEADAMVSATPGLVLGILTADCAPVLLADAEAGVIAAFHAGWKGAIAGIAGATIERMVALGAAPERIVAAIGPTICASNYEVGPEFVAELLRQHPGAEPRVSRPAGGREHFDLPGFVADRLRDSGVATVDDLALCTYAAPDRYFSHRYATHHGTITGRQIALIGLS
jgi:YfiH family protein